MFRAIGVLAVAVVGALVLAGGALFVRGRAAQILPLALLGTAAVPWSAFVDGHPYRIRYMVPLIAVQSICAGVAAGSWARGRSLMVVLLVIVAGFELRPMNLSAPMVTEAQWDRVLRTNLKGAFLCAKAAWPSMRERKRGRIIAIGSISGTLGTPLSSAYNASKWGLTGFIKSIAEEGRAHGILCATVLPGSVDTEMLEQTDFEPRMGPKDVAKVVRYLAAEAPLAMTGSAVEVFG